MDDQDIRNGVTRRLKQLAEEIGMTQAEMARRLGYAHSGVGDWYRQTSVPSIEALVRILLLREFRHVSARYLLTGEGHPVDRSVNLAAESAYDIGGMAALQQAADEMAHLQDAWATARRGKSSRGEGTSTSSPVEGAAKAGEAVQAVREQVRSQGQRKKKKGN